MNALSHDFGTLVAPDTLRIERVLPGPIERVWQHLVDPGLRAGWLAGGEIAAEPGGTVALQFHNATLSGDDDDAPPPKYAAYNGPMPMRGRVLACEPPHRLAFTWNEAEDGAASREPSNVTIELSAEGDRVRLVLTHARLASRDGLLGVAGGWHAHLALLADRLEGRPVGGFWRLHTRLEAEYDRRLPR